MSLWAPLGLGHHTEDGDGDSVFESQGQVRGFIVKFKTADYGGNDSTRVAIVRLADAFNGHKNVRVEVPVRAIENPPSVSIADRLTHWFTNPAEQRMKGREIVGTINRSEEADASNPKKGGFIFWGGHLHIAPADETGDPYEFTPGSSWQLAPAKK